ncbi:TonB family protein [Altererythrobacter sp. RZ02]|uniref:TonB family protein n=1 Tax=Pontixanthobacter rizhaonensis TaxID=2730337 RepID=A0A848QJA9_9SPHN|nr:TonB family protein [Pontixanthobacter rizhaonensis]NMW30870.1 TonB family protein [Pontixanthobacter rizhaonensis]
MAYVDQGMAADRKKAAAGVIVIHAAIGTVLVTGLATNFIPAAPPKPFEGHNVEIELPKPTPTPTPIEDIKPSADPISQPDPFTPDQAIDITPAGPVITTSTTPVPAGPVTREVLPTGPIMVIQPPVPPVPTFEPIAAKPRNAPSGWITQSDYRTSWINREYTGVARFQLSIGTNGRVQNCQIMASTGHSVLDTATCKLASRRARFEAARDSNGEKVIGSYTGSVRWELPD